MMTELELREHRREKWRLDGRPLRSAEDAAAFLESVGLCLMYPVKPPVALPTFLGACVGTDQNLSTQQQAFADARALAARGLLLDLLRRRAAFETSLLGETPLLLAPSLLPYFYALVGDRNPKAGAAAAAKISPLARDAWTALERSGPLGEGKLREVLGGSVSETALERALAELGSALRITRVDESPGGEAAWELLLRRAPEAVKEGSRLSVGESLSALISRYLDCVVAAEPRELEDFFARFAARSRVRESVNALLAARELAFLPVGGQTLIQIAPPSPPVTFRRAVPAGVHGKPKGRPQRRPAPRPGKKA